MWYEATSREGGCEVPVRGIWLFEGTGGRKTRGEGNVVDVVLWWWRLKGFLGGGFMRHRFHIWARGEQRRVHMVNSYQVCGCVWRKRRGIRVSLRSVTAEETGDSCLWQTTKVLMTEIWGLCAPSSVCVLFSLHVYENCTQQTDESVCHLLNHHPLEF